MSIDGDDCGDRQARLDWMIDEFRKAQARRLLKTSNRIVDSPADSAAKAAVITLDATVVDAASCAEALILARLDQDTR